MESRELRARKSVLIAHNALSEGVKVLLQASSTLADAGDDVVAGLVVVAAVGDDALIFAAGERAG